MPSVPSTLVRRESSSKRVGQSLDKLRGAWKYGWPLDNVRYSRSGRPRSHSFRMGSMISVVLSAYFSWSSV